MNGGETHTIDVEGDALDRAAEVFRDLGDPTRVGIISAIVSAQRAGETPLTFAELRHRLDIADSGRFNYHLKQLQPRFVQATDDGYEPRYAAIMAHGLVQARTGTSEIPDLEGSVDRPCIVCDGSPKARYASDRLTLECATYGEQILGIPVPPAVAEDRSLDELIEFAETYGLNQLQLAEEGLCPHCYGSMTTTFNSLDESSVDDMPEELIQSVQTQFTCDQCNHTFTIPVRLLVSDHPAVACFHHDHGITLSDLGMLDSWDAISVESATLEGETATLTFELNGDQLTVAIDESLTIWVPTDPDERAQK